MLLGGESARALAEAWRRATALIDHHADEMSPAILRELRRFLKQAESGLLKGESFDFTAAIAEHQRRISILMQEGMNQTATAFAREVLGDLGQGGRVRDWVKSGALVSMAASFSKDGAERFAKWTAHHLRRASGLDRGKMEAEMFRQRNVEAPRRAANAAEDRAHLASQWATDSAAGFSGEIDQRVWLSRLDGRERPSHNIAHGQHCPIHGSFIVGGYRLRFPRDPNGPVHEIANCRCVSALRRKK